MERRSVMAFDPDNLLPAYILTLTLRFLWACRERWEMWVHLVLQGDTAHM